MKHGASSDHGATRVRIVTMSIALGGFRREPRRSCGDGAGAVVADGNSSSNSY